MPTENSTGVAQGSTTCRKKRMSEQPSMSEASRSAVGSVRMYWRIMNTLVAETP